MTDRKNSLLANYLAPDNPFDPNPLGALTRAVPPPASPTYNALLDALTGGNALDSNPLGFGALARAMSPPVGGLAPNNSLLALAGLDQYRTRSSWNDRFSHWERPASLSEEGTIERAEANVRRALAGNTWLNGHRVEILPQGSYHNNTNVRQEADIDLRAVHPLLKVDYDPIVVQSAARNILSYSDSGFSFQSLFSSMRAELIRDLGRAFGASNINADDKKAIRIKGITGSRAEVDVVPAIRYHYITWNTTFARYDTTEGVAILGTDGNWTINYPEQHTANGIAKRSRTSLRFKRIARIFKRLRADMMDRKLLTVSVPSFLVECLVYNVEDEHFLFESDDRFDRVLRIARRLRALLANPLLASTMREINGIKPLFGAGQAWHRPDTMVFIDAVIAHLGAT